VIGAAFNDLGAFTDGSEIFLPGAFFVLGGLIVAICAVCPCRLRHRGSDR